MSKAEPSHRPMSETTFLIMLCMQDRPRHGYGILKDVASMSEGRLRLSTGTLYGTLKRLLARGLIERLPDPEGGGAEGRPRHPYALTDSGRKALRAESERLRSLVALARRHAVFGEG